MELYQIFRICINITDRIDKERPFCSQPGRIIPNQVMMALNGKIVTLEGGIAWLAGSCIIKQMIREQEISVVLGRRLSSLDAGLT